jgi:transcription termination factor Rho
VTETPSVETADTPAAKKPAKKAAAKSGGLNSMLLADLKSMAVGLGIAGAGSMKKAQLVDAIKSAGTPKAEPSKAAAPRAEAPQEAAQEAPRADPVADEPAPQTTVRTRTRKQRQVEQAEKQESRQEPKQDSRQDEQPQQAKQKQQSDRQDEQADRQQDNQGEQKRDKQDRQDRQDRQNEQKQGQKQQGQGKQQNQQAQQQAQHAQQQQAQQQQNQQNQQDDDDDGEGGSRRNRRRRGRDRTTVRAGGGRNEPDTTILEDDVLVPAAGILDVLDNCAFVRTSGYLPGPEDVYLSLSMVRKYHLRRGDAVVGQVRQPREGERREKFNPMVRIDSINGTEAEGAKERPDFADSVPVHPHQRLRLATDETNVIGKVVDIAAPIGKGQRGLLLTPPRTGTTTLLRSIAQSVTTNNPECHVMVVLVDTRPEEVTDYQRAVKGEVVASTFDRQPGDHTLVAELAIERAKRLVELGHDVVVLLDSLTRLGRAYNLAAPANGRVLGGLVDASAVHPTKEFFGAARKIEDAGSLTILATVSVGTGSATDEFFLEELAGTANLELVLSADRAAKGIVPAVDVAASGTRHEEKLLAPAEGAVVGDLRKQLAAAETPAAVGKVIGHR